MESKTVLKQPKKRDIFSNYITFLKTIIENGNGISLSELRDMLNENENVLFNNSELKSFISDSFGDNIQFCSSEQQNESMFVFSSKVNIQDVIDKLRSLDGIKLAAKKLRKSLLSFDFKLNEKFCDAEELKESWDNKSMPDEFLTFFAELFNIKKTSLIPDIDRNPELLDDADDEKGDEKFKNSKTEQLKILKISSLFQIMYCNLHNGRQSTPFHIMNAHSIYGNAGAKKS